MKIGFFLNFEKSLGGGHFWRCLNLAKKMKKSGRKFYFFSNIKDKNFLALLKKNNFEYIEIIEKKKEKFVKELIKKIEYLKIKNLIIDSYKINYFDEKKIKSVIKKLIVVDDHINKKHFCDLLINNNFLSSVSKKKIKKINPKIELAIGHNFNMVNNLKDKKKLYLPALNGEKKHVVDVDIPFEKPINADLTIDVENISPDEISKKIIERLKL